jgi:catechol 2,3-dioxygenase-like lactoylglutathione lyase family enzyme
MHIQRLDHVNVRTHDLAATRDFYVGVLGLREGERPPFGFPGLWLYDDTVAVVHVTGLSAADERATETGSIDHIAFRAVGLDTMRERVGRLGIAAREASVPRNGDVQIFLADPNGVRIELTFAASEAARYGRLVEH